MGDRVIEKLTPGGKLANDSDGELFRTLRSLPAAESKTTTGDRFNFAGALIFGSGMFPLPETPAGQVTAPAQGGF